jgi:hypothetical protein
MVHACTAGPELVEVCRISNLNAPCKPHALCCACCDVPVCTCSGRNLAWQTNMGTVDLRATFDKRYEFSVSSWAAAMSGMLASQQHELPA